MKIMKRISVFFLLLITVLGQVFTQENQPERSMNKILYENCLELISLMHETALSEVYGSLIPNDSLQNETVELLTHIRNSQYDTPKAVYQLEFPEDIVSFALQLMNMIDTETTEPPPHIKKKIYDTFISALAFQLNSMEGGVLNATAASAYTEEQLFVAPEVKQSGAYLFIYKDSIPVYVSVIVGKDGAVKAQGVYVFCDKTEILSDEYVFEKFSPFGIKSVTKVNVP